MTAVWNRWGEGWGGHAAAVGIKLRNKSSLWCCYTGVIEVGFCYCFRNPLLPDDTQPFAVQSCMCVCMLTTEAGQNPNKHSMCAPETSEPAGSKPHPPHPHYGSPPSQLGVGRADQWGSKRFLSFLLCFFNFLMIKLTIFFVVLSHSILRMSCCILEITAD